MQLLKFLCFSMSSILYDILTCCVLFIKCPTYNVFAPTFSIAFMLLLCFPRCHPSSSRHPTLPASSSPRILPRRPPLLTFAHIRPHSSTLAHNRPHLPTFTHIRPHSPTFDHLSTILFLNLSRCTSAGKHMPRHWIINMSLFTRRWNSERSMLPLDKRGFSVNAEHEVTHLVLFETIASCFSSDTFHDFVIEK